MNESQEASTSEGDLIDKLAGILGDELNLPKPDKTPEPENQTKEPEQSAKPQEEEPKQQEPIEEEEVVFPRSFEELASLGGKTPEELAREITRRVKVDGDEHDVTLEELQKSYQLSKHLSEEIKRNAESRKAFDEERNQILSALQQKMTTLSQESNIAEKMIQEKYSEINWQELEESDPGEYSRMVIKYNNDLYKLNTLKANLQNEMRFEQQKALEKQQMAFRGKLADESQKLLDAIPEWRDPDIASKEQKLVRDYLKSSGFSDAELNNVYDHRYVVMAKKALAYDQLKKTAPETSAKLKSLPKVLKPGAAKTKDEVTAEARRSKIDKFRKSGRDEDAVALLKDLL